MSMHCRVAVFAALLTLAACGHVAPFVWVDSLKLPSEAGTSEYVIGTGDLLSIQVWEQDKMSTKGRVREDGKISFPFLYDVAVAGKAPSLVASELELALRPFVLAPKVNVVVEEPKPLSVSVLGQVVKPGQYVMDRGAGVAQVLASAGGLTAFAHKDRIFVVREFDQRQQRVRFTFQSLTDATGAATKFRVKGGDVVVVE